MKIEDAIEGFKIDNSILDERYCPGVVERNRMAIDALEKQMPKNPEQTTANDTVMIGDLWHGLETAKYKCSCGKHVNKDQKYCDECGQKLKWGE